MKEYCFMISNRNKNTFLKIEIKLKNIKKYHVKWK